MVNALLNNHLYCKHINIKAMEEYIIYHYTCIT